MRVLVTGSSGHLGEALMRTLPAAGLTPVGLDIRPGPFTDHVGSICDRAVVARAMAGAGGVIHAATLHKPQVGSQPAAAFVEVNVGGALALLECAVEAGVGRFVFTSTTSAFGAALRPAADEPTAWIDEDASGPPKNIYGATKTAAEDLCRLIHRQHGLPVIVLRTSRFFPEADDDDAARAGWSDDNLKANEYLHRRVDIGDAAAAHLAALERAPALGFGLYVVSATTPFRREDAAALRRDPAAVMSLRAPGWEAVYRAAGFRPPAEIDRVYDNARARRDLGWRPDWDFTKILARIAAGAPLRSPLAQAVGAKGYAGAGAIYGAPAAAAC